MLPLDGAFDAYNAERLRAAGTLLLGRRTYEGFKGFWPSVVDELHLIVGAVVLGGGTPAFERQPPGALRSLAVRKLDGSENVLVRYAVERRG